MNRKQKPIKSINALRRRCSDGTLASNDHRLAKTCSLYLSPHHRAARTHHIVVGRPEQRTSLTFICIHTNICCSGWLSMCYVLYVHIRQGARSAQEHNLYTRNARVHRGSNRRAAPRRCSPAAHIASCVALLLVRYDIRIGIGGRVCVCMWRVYVCCVCVCATDGDEEECLDVCMCLLCSGYGIFVKGHVPLNESHTHTRAYTHECGVTWRNVLFHMCVLCLQCSFILYSPLRRGVWVLLLILPAHKLHPSLNEVCVCVCGCVAHRAYRDAVNTGCWRDFGLMLLVMQ